MLIGAPKELQTHEYRVGLIPGAVRELVHRGHKAVVEANAGGGIGFDDAAYQAVGAAILARPAEVFAIAELIVKVKEPQPQEVALLREGRSDRASSLSRTKPSPTVAADCRFSPR